MKASHIDRLRRWLVGLAFLVGLTPARAGHADFAPVRTPPPMQRGVALGLFAEDVSFSYAPLLDEIAALGATHVALIVPVYQEHAASTTLAPHTRLSPSPAAIADAIRAALRAGLQVTVFPIVRLSAPRTANEWRGTLAPADRAAWFDNYTRIMTGLASLATLHGATRFVVGSELSSLDGELDHWRTVVGKVRAVFRGPLVYSSNWDHYRDARLFELVDEAGVVAYFDLRRAGGPSDDATLTARWRGLRTELESWAAGLGKPFVFTEVGYRSRQGASATPWDETPGGRVDVDEQARAFAAFRAAWTAPADPGATGKLAGYYIWNFYGYGGPHSIGYTPRGKPALHEVRRLLDEL